MIKELMFEGSNRYFDKMICPELEISESDIQNLCVVLYNKALENSKSQFEKDAVTPIYETRFIIVGNTHAIKQSYCTY